VEWEGQDGLETMSLKEAQAAATAEFTDAEWLPPAIRTLLEVGVGLALPWLDLCASLTPDASSRGRLGACLAAGWVVGGPAATPAPRVAFFARRPSRPHLDMSKCTFGLSAPIMASKRPRAARRLVHDHCLLCAGRQG
jgi:hypothetical protein